MNHFGNKNDVSTTLTREDHTFVGNAIYIRGLFLCSISYTTLALDCV